MEEEKYMRRCIQLAQNGLCNAAPNPMVGAVIVCDGKIIGEGYHVRCGEAHAEVNARFLLVLQLTGISHRFPERIQV